jgi:hypothetical protein
VPGGSKDIANAIRTLSRLKYGRARSDAELEINVAGSVAEKVENAEQISE